MNNLQIFDNSNFGQVRAISRNGEPWFVAADVCAALEIDRTQTRRLDEDERGVYSTQTLGGEQGVTFVNESGLYSLVLGSRKPEAKHFKRWITHDVIPSIRKTGGYVANDDLFLATYLPNADEATAALFKTTLATMRNLNARIEADKPKVLFASAVEASKTSILIGELAKLIRQNGVEIGQNRLFTWLRDNGYLIKRNGTDYNMPTQYSMERGWFEVKETAISRSDGSITVSKTTKVTGKGQTYFVNVFLGVGA
jgi:anti-repressor protein